MKSTPSAQLAYTVSEAADVTRMSQDTIRKAIRATNPRNFPPPLRAKRVGTGPRAKHLILAADLMSWLSTLPDA